MTAVMLDEAPRLYPLDKCRRLAQKPYGFDLIEDNLLVAIAHTKAALDLADDRPELRRSTFALVRRRARAVERRIDILRAEQHRRDNLDAKRLRRKIADL